MRLGNYTGLHVQKPDLTIREEDIDNILARMQRRNAVIIHIDDGDNIRKILESQPIDDDFARDFSEFDTLSELREGIREDLAERRLISADERIQRELLAQIISDSDIPVDKEAVQEISDALYDNLLDDLDESGISMKDYLKRRNMTEKQFEKEKDEEAVLALKSETVLRAIAEREGLSVLPNEVADEIRAMAEEDGVDPAVYAEEFDDEFLADVEDELLMGKAMDFVVDHAIFDE